MLNKINDNVLISVINDYLNIVEIVNLDTSICNYKIRNNFVTEIYPFVYVDVINFLNTNFENCYNCSNDLEYRYNNNDILYFSENIYNYLFLKNMTFSMSFDEICINDKFNYNIVNKINLIKSLRMGFYSSTKLFIKIIEKIVKNNFKINKLNIMINYELFTYIINSDKYCNLQELSCYIRETVENINININLQKLQIIKLHNVDNSLCKIIDVSKCYNLRELHVSLDSVLEINLPNNSNLILLELSCNNIKMVNCTNTIIDHVKLPYVSNIYCDTLLFLNNINIINLTINFEFIVILNLNNFINLEHVDITIRSKSLKTITATDCTKLKSLHITKRYNGNKILIDFSDKNENAIENDDEFSDIEMHLPKYSSKIIYE